MANVSYKEWIMKADGGGGKKEKLPQYTNDKPNYATYGEYVAGAQGGTNEPSSAASVPSGTPAVTPSGTTTPAGTTAPSATPSAPSSTGVKSYYGEDIKPIDSYEEFLRKRSEGYDYTKELTDNFYTSQGQKALDAIDAQKAAADTYAQGLYDTTDAAIAEQKAASDAHAQQIYDKTDAAIAEQKTAADAYSQDVYDTTGKAITEQKAASDTHAQQIYDKTGAAISEQKDAAIQHAASQKDLTVNTSLAEQQAAHKYADEKLAADLGFNKATYDTLINAINQQKVTGDKMNAELRDLLLNMSTEQRDTIYRAAEERRAAEEYQADVDRQRAIVDANSAYEQNKAGYGAKAEAVARMGLTGGGYADWLDTQAYAQQRAETQAARATSDAVKRQARYTESEAKTNADLEHLQNSYTANKEFAERDYDIDTSYQTNMLAAESEKLQGDYAAQGEARDSKYNADSAHRQNVYSAEYGYNDAVHSAETSEREGKLENELTYADYLNSNAAAERESKLQNELTLKGNQYDAETSEREGKLENELTYADYLNSNATAERESRLQNDLTLNDNMHANDTAHRSDKLAAEQVRDQGLLESELSYANNMLNNDTDIANYRKTEEERLRAEAEEKETTARGVYTDLLGAANSGDYTAEQLGRLADEYGLSPDQKESLIKAANDRETAAKTEAETATNNQQTLNKLEIQGYITSDTTDAEIDSYVEDGLISEKDAESLKETRATAAKTELSGLVKNGDYAEAADRADELYESGVIDLDTYQGTYFGGSLVNCESAKTTDEIKQVEADLKNLRDQGKISQSDYNSLVAYMYQSAGGRLDNQQNSVSVEQYGLGHNMTVKFGNTNYKFSIKMDKSKVDVDTAETLTKICGGKPNANELVTFGENLYCYYGGNWLVLPSNSSTLKAAYDKQLGYQAGATAPKHKADKSSDGGSTSSGGTGLTNGNRLGKFQSHK